MISQSVSWHWLLSGRSCRGEEVGEDPAMTFPPPKVQQTKRSEHVAGRKTEIYTYQKTEIEKHHSQWQRERPGDPRWTGVRMDSPWPGPGWPLRFHVFPLLPFAPCAPAGPKLLDIHLPTLTGCCSLSLCQASNFPAHQELVWTWPLCGVFPESLFLNASIPLQIIVSIGYSAEGICFHVC